MLPQVLKEIDSKKRDGRVAEQARAFNRLIGPAAETGQPINVREEGPRVDITLARCHRIDWSQYDDLDPEDGDSKVVAQLLNAYQIPLAERVLISHDINPNAMAARRGLRAIRPPDSWLRPRESSPADKEIQRLKQRLAELEKSQPKLQLSISIQATQPIPIYKVAALTEDEQTDLVTAVLTEHPRPSQPSNRGLGLSFDSLTRDHTLDDRYDAYSEKVVPSYAKQLHQFLERTYDQIPISIQVENTGNIQAEKLVVEIDVTGGWINDRFVIAPMRWPRPPKPRHPHHLPNFPTIDPISRPPGRHEIHFTQGPDKGPSVIVNCEDFRQGKEWSFDGVLGIDPQRIDALSISVRVTAANLHGQLVETAIVKTTVSEVHATALFDLSEGTPIEPLPMADALKTAIESRSLDGIDFEAIGKD